MQMIRKDRLLQVWYDPKTGRRFAQGKRVSRDCPLTREEIRAYVESGGNIVRAVQFIKDTRRISLAAAKELIDSARRPAFLHRRRVA